MGILTIYRKQFNHNKTLAERSMVQLNDYELFCQNEKKSKSIAKIMNDISINLIYGWTDIQIVEGEKYCQEIIKRDVTRRRDLISNWHIAWSQFEGTLESLLERDLEKNVFVKDQNLTIHKAIIIQLRDNHDQTAQIVNLGKLIKGEEWLSLSVPIEKSNAVNKYEFTKGSKRHYFNNSLYKNKDLLIFPD